MKPSLQRRLDEVKVKSLDMSLAGARGGARKLTPTPEEIRQAGLIVGDILHFTRLTPAAFGALMGYSDKSGPSKVSRWQNGEDLPHFFIRLVTNTTLLEGLMKAGANRPGDPIHFDESIRFVRKAGGQ